MNFGQAIEALKTGSRVSRAGWNGKGMWLGLQRQPEDLVTKLHPYIFMSDVNGVLFPWNPNNLDMLAEDWGVVGTLVQ